LDPLIFYPFLQPAIYIVFRRELALFILLVLSGAEGSEVEGSFAMCFRCPQSFFTKV